MKNIMEEPRQSDEVVQFERDILLRRLRGLGVDPIVTCFDLNNFYWDLLRLTEKGGN